MDSENYRIADKLFAAWRDRLAIDSEPALAALRDAERGRAIQKVLNALSVKAGRRPIGWKIGLTSQAALDLFGAEEPMVGVIYADTLLADDALLPTSEIISPRIEGEMLLELGSVPPPGASDEDLVASLASVSVAFEIADSRFLGWPSAIGGAIADNACCGWLLRAPGAIEPSKADYEGTAMAITRNGETISEGVTAACLGSVLRVYRWFIEDSHRRGRHLQAGDIILTGAMGPAILMEAPATYRLDCPGLGSASLRFGASA